MRFVFCYMKDESQRAYPRILGHEASGYVYKLSCEYKILINLLARLRPWIIINMVVGW